MNTNNLFIYFTLYPGNGVAGIISEMSSTIGYLQCDAARAFYAWGRQDGWAEIKGFTAYIDTGKEYEPTDALNTSIRVTRNGIQYGKIKSEIPIPIQYCESKKIYKIPEMHEIPNEETQINIVHLPESKIWFKLEKYPHEKPDWKKRQVYTEVTSMTGTKPLGDFNAYIISPFPRDWLLNEEKSITPTVFEHVYELTDMKYNYLIPKVATPIDGVITPQMVMLNEEPFDTSNLIEMKPSIERR